MKQILITGEHGYIGTNLARFLAQDPTRYEIKRLPLRGRTPDEYDFHGADAIVHAAAIVHRKNTKKLQPLYDAVNRDLTLALAEKAKREGVRQFVFFSSIGVYGRIEGVIGAETEPAPRTRYDRSKLEAEQAIARLADGTFCVTIVRSPMVFGAGANGNPARLYRLARHLPACPDFENRRVMVSIGTLCKTVKDLLDTPRAGIFVPQETTPLPTAALIARAMETQGRAVKKTRLLNPAIRALRACTRIGKKAFGDLLYEGPFEQALPVQHGEEAER